jgi:hypothetical protein
MSKEVEQKLARQRAAMAAYHPEDYDPQSLTNETVEEGGYLDGDTLALFIWREVGDAASRAEAAEMLDRAAAELGRVSAHMESLSQPITTPAAEPPNPRFVWNMGAIHERYPDMPAEMLDEDSDGIKLWDRQEKRAVATIHKDYYQAMCLEMADHPERHPFTNLENWFNSLSNEDLESEGMTPTREEYHTQPPTPSTH